MSFFSKSIFSCVCFLITIAASAQSRIIYYNNDSLSINETLIKGNSSKEKLDNILQSKSKNGIFYHTHDEIISVTKAEKQRHFGYPELGISYDPFVKDPDRFSFAVRLEFEGDEAKWFKRQYSAVYTGALLIGKQFITTGSSLEKIVADPAFKLIKQGDIIIGKRRMIYALVSFQDILIKLFYSSENGHLKLVVLNK